MEITDSKQGLGLIHNDDLSVGSFHGLNICLGSLSHVRCCNMDGTYRDTPDGIYHDTEMRNWISVSLIVGGT